jgi:thioredoxin 1
VLLEIIDDAPGRADQHVNALFQHAPLRVVTGTAENETQSESGVRTQRHGILVNLHRQLARRREHDCPRLRRTTIFRQVRQQIIEGREQERRGFAGAGLRLAGHVLPGQRQRQSFGLDRRAKFETGLAHALKQGLGQVKAGEGLAGKVVITHKTGAKHNIIASPTALLGFGNSPTCIPWVFLPKLLSITRSRQPTASQSGRIPFNDDGGKQHMSQGIVNISDDSFEEEVLKAEGPVLVDYWAEWCGPCKIIAPVLQEIAAEYQGKLKIAKLNIDENPQTPPKYGIRGIPTLMLFKNGSVEATKVGAVSKSQLAAFIDGNL